MSDGNGAGGAPLILTQPNVDLRALTQIVGDQLVKELRDKGLEQHVGIGIIIWTDRERTVNYYSSRGQRAFHAAANAVIKYFNRPRTGG